MARKLILMNKREGLAGAWLENGAIRMLQHGEARAVPEDQIDQVVRRWGKISRSFAQVTEECAAPNAEELIRRKKQALPVPPLTLK